MAQLFEKVFSKIGAFEVLFFNIKSVLIYPNLDELQRGNPVLFERWKNISKTKYNVDFENVESIPLLLWKTYENNAPYYPEYSRIVAITYGNLYNDENSGEIKRFIRKLVGDEETVVIDNFINILQQLSNEGVQSTPQYFPAFCGYNILGHDIPLLIKRFLLHKEKLKVKQLPLIIRKALDAKPWESSIVDLQHMWRFNGYDNTSLMLIADFLNLKKTTDLMATNELSKYYWENIEADQQKTLEFVALQSATQTNLTMQLMTAMKMP
jgi:hypothetical protein